jgi:hypothetical protein
MSLIRSALNLAQYVHAPHAQAPQGPVCLTCGRVVSSEHLVEGYPGETVTAKVLVRHHGAEELRTFDFGSTNWDEADLASMMRRTNWFDPRSHEGAGLGQKIKSPDDHDDESEAPRVFVP